MNLKEIQNIPDITREPTGFPNRIDSTIDFNNINRRFTIEPSVTGGTFTYYIKGTQYIKSSAQTIDLPNSYGTYFIYFDGDELKQRIDWTDDLIFKYAYVALITWDSTNYKNIIIADERHGIVMDGQTHLYLHVTVGTRYDNGLSLGNYTTSGDGDNNADAQMSIDNGVIWDEDIKFSIEDDNLQNLYSVADIPVLYRSGTEWRKDDATSFPVKQGTTNIQFNQLGTGGVWTTQEATDGNYVAMFILAVTDINNPIVALLGQREDSNLNQAEDNNAYENLVLDDFPTKEAKILYRLIFQTNNSYVNTPKCRLVAVQDLRNVSNLPGGNYIATSHNALTDRDVLGSHKASAISFTPAGSISADDVQEAIEELDVEKQDALVEGDGIDIDTGNIISVDETEIDVNQIPFSATGFSAINIYDAILESGEETEHDAIKIQGKPVDIPQTSDDGKILTYDQTTDTFILTLKGIYFSNYVEDETQSSSTDNVNWTQKLRMTYTPLISGTYIISWQAEIANSAQNKGVMCRLEQNDTIELGYSLNAPIVGMGWATCGGFKRINLSTISYNFDVDFKLEGTGTAYIRRVRVEIRKAKD